MLRILAIIFTAFLTIGLAMPVLPLHVHLGLGFGSTAVGIVAGCQFASSLSTRICSGQFSDHRGARPTVLVGLALGCLAGFCYGLSLTVKSHPLFSLILLIAGRGLLGGAESFVITGTLIWALRVADSKTPGKTMSQVGMALWASYAMGAPVGSVLYARGGFGLIALCTVILPVLAFLLARNLPSPPVAATKNRVPMLQVLRLLWLPGLGLAFSGLGFGSVTAFLALYFSARGWGLAWLALTILGGSFVLGRFTLGHLPDRIGGARVALYCVLLEALGQLMIWAAPAPSLVFVGVALTGFGYSLAYPGFGLEAVANVKQENQGFAMGVYTAFLDLSLGLGCPVLGLVASRFGLRCTFLLTALAALVGAVLAWKLTAIRREKGR